MSNLYIKLLGKNSGRTAHAKCVKLTKRMRNMKTLSHGTRRFTSWKSNTLKIKEVKFRNKLVASASELIVGNETIWFLGYIPVAVCHCWFIVTLVLFFNSNWLKMLCPYKILILGPFSRLNLRDRILRISYSVLLISFQLIDNQKLGLCEALLNLGDWDHAKQLIDRLPSNSAVSNPEIAKALCLLVSKLIDPVYRR